MLWGISSQALSVVQDRDTRDAQRLASTVRLMESNQEETFRFTRSIFWTDGTKRTYGVVQKLKMDVWAELCFLVAAVDQTTDAYF